MMMMTKKMKMLERANKRIQRKIKRGSERSKLKKNLKKTEDLLLDLEHSNRLRGTIQVV